MVELPKPISTGQPQPEILTEQATGTSLAKELIELKGDLANQRKENKNFIYWVVSGVVAIVAVVAIEVILFHTRADKDFLDLQNQYFQEIEKLREKVSQMQCR
ncbi:MAG: hypothetical protein WC348_00755 [Patescibacteria group bacterium]|jgi:hypothetical protein